MPVQRRHAFSRENFALVLGVVLALDDRREPARLELLVHFPEIRGDEMSGPECALSVCAGQVEKGPLAIRSRQAANVVVVRRLALVPLRPVFAACCATARRPTPGIGRSTRGQLWRAHSVSHSGMGRGHTHLWNMASDLVGDTGIEPVTSSVSRKRAPAAPIALTHRSLKSMRGGDGI